MVCLLFLFFNPLTLRVKVFSVSTKVKELFFVSVHNRSGRYAVMGVTRLIVRDRSQSNVRSVRQQGDTSPCREVFLFFFSLVALPLRSRCYPVRCGDFSFGSLCSASVATILTVFFGPWPVCASDFAGRKAARFVSSPSLCFRNRFTQYYHNLQL